MSKVRVPIFGRLSNYVAVEANATVGARIGLDLFNADGTLFDPEALLAQVAPTADPATPPAGAGYTDAMADARVAAGIATHLAAENPHPQYMLASASLQPVPTTVADGATYTVPADTQALFTLPITLEGTGTLDVSGALVEVA